MKHVSTRPVMEVAALEARRLLCSDHDLVGMATSPRPEGDAPITLPAVDAAPETVDQLIVPQYSSRPSAGRKLYLDFNGHGSIDNWNGWWEFGGHDVPATPTYDIDNDLFSYSQQELANILQIWKGVAEKFSPFNVDVTTIRPSTINGVRVVIGGDGAWLGRGGGVASVGGWGEEGFTDANSANVAFVWAGQKPSDPNYIIEAAAHEAGHTLGLYHQSLPPIATNEYAPGFIMGSGGRWANTAVHGTVATTRDDDTVQSKGSQNDLNTITSGNGFTFRTDDVGNTIGTAATLTLSLNSGVLEGAAAGVIEQMPDVDIYRINHTGGSLDVEVLAAEFGRMLDPRMSLLNSTGGVIATSTNNSGSDGAGERIQFNQLNSGTYYVQIFGSTAYGDIGQYRLNARAGLATTAVNDTVSTATRLFAFGSTDATSWGPIGYAGTSVIADSVASNDTIDYFKFLAPPNTRRIDARLSGQTTSVSLAVYNDVNGNGIIETGEILGAHNPSTSFQSVTVNPANAGTMYYVRVMKASAAAAGNYNLAINTDTAPASLPATLTPATFDPAPLRGGRTIYESIDNASADTTDYYRITAEVDGQFSFYMTNWGSGDLRLDIGRDLNGNGVFDSGEITNSSNSNGAGGGEFIQSVNILGGQTYLVRIMQAVAGSSSNYSIQAVADYATGGNLTGSLVGARDLTLQPAGTIYEYFDASVDRFDTFKIAPPTGTMQARFTALESGASHKLEIIRDANNNGTVDSGEIVASGFTGQLLTHTVTAGAQYYLRMQSVLFGEFFSTGNYKLVYNTNGAINTWTTPSTAGNITVGPTQLALANFLQYDPSDTSNSNTEDYFRFTLAARSRFDVSINGPVGPNGPMMGVAVGRDPGNGTFQRIGGVGKNQGNVINLSVNLDPGTYLIRTYLPIDERQTELTGGSYGLFFKTAAVTDNSPPVVTAADFQYEIKPVGVSFTFDQDVAGSVDSADVEIRNLGTNQTFPIDAVFYNATLRKAGYGVADGVLPDGNYRATLQAGAVRDLSANPNPGAHTHDFFVFAGDANRDRSININDFSILATRFNLPGTFSQGDFNYDHRTDIADFSILASKFNTTLPAAGDLPRASAPAVAARLSGQSSALFGGQRVDNRVLDEVMG